MKHLKKGLSIVLSLMIVTTSIIAILPISHAETTDPNNFEDSFEYDEQYYEELNKLIPNEDYVEGEILVKYLPKNNSETLETITEEFDLSVEYNLEENSNTFQTSSVNDSIDREGLYVLSFDDKTSVVDLVQEVSTFEGIEYAQPNYIYKTCEVTTSHPDVDVVNDRRDKTYTNSQLSMFKSLVSERTDEWWTPSGGSGIRVAVIDSGIDLNHPALSGCLWNENGIYGYNTTDPNNITAITMANSNDYATGHGTHVAGIIGMQNINDEYSCKGIAPGVEIIDLQATNSIAGTFETVSLIAALEKAVELDADVVNISIGGYNYDRAWNLTCNRAARDLVIVSSAGNNEFDAIDFKAYPAAFSSVISVMAYGGEESYINKAEGAENYISNNYPSTGSQKIASFSNYDYNLRCYDIVAPGTNVCSANAGGAGNISGYCFLSGTSMASPVVAAAVALYLERYPLATPGQVRTALRTTSERETISGRFYPIANKLDITKFINTEPNESANSIYENGVSEENQKFCELIKRNLGYDISEEITITNDDLTLISKFIIDSYEAIGNNISNLDDFSRVISLTVSGYDFDDAKISLLFNENRFNNLESLEICNTSVYNIRLNGAISSSIFEYNFHDNVNLSSLTGFNSTSVVSFNLENNNISDLSFLNDSIGVFDTLYLSGNKIKDLTPLTEMLGVLELHLANNCIEDFTPLLNVPGLLFVDISQNYLCESEQDIEEFLNTKSNDLVFIYKPFKEDFVEIDNIDLNDFDIKRTDINYVPKIKVTPLNATYATNTILSATDDNIITVNKYTKQINYNPSYNFDPTEDEFTTTINYTNGSFSGTATLNLLMPVIKELNYEKYNFDTGVSHNYITLLTTIDTTKVKVVQTYTSNGNVKGAPIEVDVLSESEYFDYGTNRIITFSYEETVEEDTTVTVYAGDSLGYFSSETICAPNTIEISVIGTDISSVSGCSQFLNIINDDNISGIGNNAINNSCDIENIYIPEKISSLGENAFNSSNVKNAIFYCLDNYNISENAFGTCSTEFKVYTSDSNSELAEVCNSDGIVCITDYEFTNNTLVKCNLRANSITLPECLRITTIGERAFSSKRSLGTIDLGEYVCEIGDYAFFACSSLHNVINLDKVKILGESAFRASKVTNIDISNAESIGKYAFSNCTNLVDVYLIGDILENEFIINDTTFNGCDKLETVSYKGTLVLGSKAFAGCSKLRALNCTDVELIGTEAFSGCASLKEVVLSETSNVPDNTFLGCSSLKKVQLKNTGVLSIGENAFSGTLALKELGLLAREIYFSANSFDSSASDLIVFCNADAIKTERPNTTVCTDFQTLIMNNKIILSRYYGTSANVVIPDCLEIYQIGSTAFYLNKKITSVYIPDSVYEIERYSFDVSINLSQILNGKNVVFIGEYAFSYCTSLNDISSLESIQILEEFCFANSGVKKIKMPDNVYECEHSVFKDCKNLTEIIYSKNIRKIPKKMFLNCTSLERCILNNMVVSIHDNAFENCSSLEQIYLPNSVKYIYTKAFSPTVDLYSSDSAPIALGTANIVDSETNNLHAELANNIYPNYKVEKGILLDYQSQEGYDYTDTDGKRVVDVPNAVERIADHVFFNNKNIDKVVLSNYLKTIDDCAFMDCSVKEIIMPKTMSSIGVSAFNRTRITSMDIPEGITKIENYFMHSTPIQHITIPDSVTEIGKSAFASCNKLNSVFIPDSVNLIDDSAFEKSKYPISFWGKNNSYLNQYAITNSHQNNNNIFICNLGFDISEDVLISYTGSNVNVQIPFGIGLTTISGSVFKNNTTVETISIASGITAIGTECFSGCTSLTALVIPDDVVSVGANAFYGIPNLTVYCNEGSFIEGYCIENNINVNNEFDIADGILKAYNGYDENLSIPSNLCITTIGTEAFYGNINLHSVTIPEDVYKIDGLAFSSCVNLHSVSLPATNSIEISKLAFCDCKELINIYNSTSIIKIEDWAFSLCDKLQTIDLSNVESISRYAFSYCDSLTNVILGTSLSSIENGVFDNCDNIIINCYAGTVAHQYAINNNLQYVLLGDIGNSNLLKAPIAVNVELISPDVNDIHEHITNTTDEELNDYICREYGNKISESDIYDIVDYILKNKLL